MRLHAIIHAPFEKLGAIEKWAKDKKYSVSETHTYQNEKLPEISEFDFLIILGGPQSATELDKFPFLKDEIEFTKQVITANKPIVGICLGAQIIGEALGAATEHSEFKEVGSFPIQLTEGGLQDDVFKHFDREFNVFHWHGDMPGLGEGAVLLAKSRGCSRQAFRYGDRVYGLQFHLEMTNETIKSLMLNCETDMEPGKYIKSPEVMILTDCTFANEKMYKLLNHLEKFVIPASLDV